MATRSMIASKQNDGTIKAIYCHWDGYINGNGKILFEHYKDNDKVEKLLNMGYLSSLGEDPIEEPNGWDYTKEHDSTKCVSYRARGDQGVDAIMVENEDKLIEAAKNCGAEFVYLYEFGHWYCQEIPFWSDLEYKLEEEKEEQV